jgi:hypothetical protein
VSPALLGKEDAPLYTEMKDLLLLVIGGAIGFISSWLQWRLNLKEDRKKLRLEKLEVLVGKIHEANQLLEAFLRVDGRSGNRAQMESVFNDVYILVRLYFPEFGDLEHRLGRAFLLMLGTASDADRRDWQDRVNQLKSELNGFEQDVVNLFQGRVKREELTFPEIK